jgi:sugar lactone lactonase YvrE
MTTIAKTFRHSGGLRRAASGLATLLFAAALHGQQEVTTVISTGLNEPGYVAADPNNNIYITDSVNNRIVEFVPTTNGVFTLAGSSTAQSGLSNSIFGDQALFSQPMGMVYDSFRGGLVVVDQANQVLRLVTLNGVVSTLAGVPATPANPDGGFTDGPAAAAQFSYPVGIATDGVGNLYVADTGNSAIRRVNSTNGVSTVQVINYNFYQPNAVALDTNNNLWVADTRNDTICVISNIGVIVNQSAYVMAGSIRQPGTNDAANAAAASFNQPAGLLWDPNGAGLLISDTGNNTIRRLYPNTTEGGLSVQTVAGLPGKAGNADGTVSIAEFNSPLGLTVDAINNGYYIVDMKNNSLRRFQTGPPLPAVPNPQIGLVSFPVNISTGEPTSVFTALPNGGIFNTNNIIAIYNTDTDPNIQTYYVVTNTPANQFASTPVPTTNSLFAPNYPGDGSAENTQDTTSLLAPVPYEVTLYAISIAKGRPSSQVVSANFSYITAPPVIGGNNGAAVQLTDLTTPSTLWYTLSYTSNSVPPVVNGAGSIGPLVPPTNIFFLVNTNVTLTVQAFSPGFAPSALAVQTFAASNFVTDQMTFGFASGEASSEFIGAAGQRFYAPVTLTLISNSSMYSLQFNVTVTNLAGAPPVTPTYTFDSMLQKPVQVNGATLYVPIPTEMFTNGGFQDLRFTNSGLNLLGVGWLEIPPETNLYNTVSQDLITFSMAHETLFTKSSGSVIVGAYSFDIPGNAALNQSYQIQIGRPSADGDGFAQNVLIQSPTNGSLGAGAINSIKNVTVGIVPYLVGDVAPFRWLNAGDFGDGNLLNNDVLETFRSAVYYLNTPVPGSDFYDAMDSSDGSFNNYYAETDAAINNIMFGDGKLDVTDVYVTFRRSLDPSLYWVQRFWSNNGAGGSALFAQTVPNVLNPANPTVVATPAIAGKPSATSKSGAKSQAQSAGAAHSISVKGDVVQAGGNLTVSVPVRVVAADSLPIRVLAINVDLVPLDGSPAITNTVNFSPAAGLGSPAVAMSQGVNNYAAAWLNSTNAGVSGANIIGAVTVTLPANVTANSSYLVHFEHFSASPNGLALFPSTVTDGLITVGNRNISSWNDGIPDWWRLLYFGTVSNLLSAANLDPDGDGASNWQEYVAGTNPMDPASVLQLTPLAPAPNFTVQWPSVVGKTYMVQSSSSLISTNWSITASNLPGTGLMMQLSDTNLPAPPARFYRVQVQ